MGAQPLVNRENAILWGAPPKLTVDEQAKPVYATTFKIETLIKELKEKGPFVAQGPFGLDDYTSAPFQLKSTFGKQKVYGWKPGTHKDMSFGSITAMIVGAQIVEGKGYVYLQHSQDCTIDPKKTVREHRLAKETRLFIVSNNSFYRKLFDLYPSVSEKKLSDNFKTVGNLPCSERMQDYVIKLASLNLNSILDKGEGEQMCVKLGQEIFQKFKNRYDVSTGVSGSIPSMQQICDFIKEHTIDGHLRHQYISRAWNGIGEDSDIWMA